MTTSRRELTAYILPHGLPGRLVEPVETTRQRIHAATPASTCGFVISTAKSAVDP
jgi:hypothetical protein